MKRFPAVSPYGLGLLVLRFFPHALAGEVSLSLDVRNAIVSPDGFPRSAVTVNGTLPAPLISANVGDRLIINVMDNLEDPTMMRSASIHWHGLHQTEKTFIMDGASSITQCPIVPGHSFAYNFSTGWQSGTFWYHAHIAPQLCDGLSGPLVVYDPEDPLKHLYDIDDESTVITLSDWYHKPALSYKLPPTPDPDSNLINGVGRWKGNLSNDLAIVRAQVDKRYRFRLINMACNPFYNFSIESHNLTIIEADGIETEPVAVDSVQIAPGQRYSFVVTMDKPIDNYWIRAIPGVPANSTAENGTNSAILRYDGAPIAEPSEHQESDRSQNRMLKETDLHPFLNPGAPGKPYPGGADVVLTLQPRFLNGTWLVNGSTFKRPSVPVLLQILSGSRNAKDILPAGTVYTLPPNVTVEVTINSVRHHPFHLHGHYFDIVKPSGTEAWNFENPVRRDVISANDRNDTMTLRFVTDNPGPWLFHCHLDWHFLTGLAVVFVEDVDQIANADPKNDAWSSLCPLYDEFNPDKHFGL